jgi:hypothetical protein
MRRLLLCSLVATAQAACECSSPQQVKDNKHKDHLDLYGVECSNHDAVSSPVEPCAGDVTTKPSWCFRSWCYVNMSCYHHTHPAYHLFGQIARSYEACGEMGINYYGANLAGGHVSPDDKGLANQKIRAFMMNNTGGWTGSFLNTKGHNLKSYGSAKEGDSPYVEFAKLLANAGKFTYEFVDPLAEYPKAVTDQLTAQGETISSGSVCAMGTTLDLWDLCIGMLTVTEPRSNYAKFLPALGKSDEYLIVKVSVKKPTFAEHMATVFAPFSGELWAIIVGFLVVFAFAMAFCEGVEEGGDFEDSTNPGYRYCISTYMAFLSFCAGPGYNPVSPAGRIVFLGFAWLLCITLASYTANLASLLVVASSVGNIEDMAQLIKQDGAKLCVPHPTFQTSYAELYPALKGRIVVSVGNDQTIRDLEDGKCAGAALSIDDLDVLQAHAKSCSLGVSGRSLRALNIAFAVSQNFQNRLAPLVSTVLAQDKLSHILSEAQPRSACPSMSSPSSDELNPRDLAGVLVTAAALLVLGLLFHLVSKLRGSRSTPPATSETSVVDKPAEMDARASSA